MQDSPIQIGPIGLHGFEIPSSIRFGGRYRLAVHKLSSGRRVLERLGPDDGEVAFQGTFSGMNAEARVRAFDALRLSGEIVWLTWESFRRQVVVKSFVAEYHSPWWIPYEISCVVVHQAGTTTSQVSTVATQISADLGVAVSALVGSTVSLIPLQLALDRTNAFMPGTLDQIQALAAVDTTQQAINAQIALLSALLMTQMEPRPESYGTSQAFSAVVDSAGLLATTVNGGFYVGRIGTNLQNARD